jgi:hypothetical protein
MAALSVIPGQASGLSARAVDRADNFLSAADRGREILNFVHFGAEYHGHEFVKTVDLSDGDFALVYRYHWEESGVTDVAFLCNARGDFQSVEIVRSNAELSQPFLAANVTIKMVGSALLEANKRTMSRDDQNQLQALVDSADAKGILEWLLRYEQSSDK